MFWGYVKCDAFFRRRRTKEFLVHVNLPTAVLKFCAMNTPSDVYSGSTEEVEDAFSAV
jgi:hypothetical protein